MVELELDAGFEQEVEAVNGYGGNQDSVGRQYGDSCWDSGHGRYSDYDQQDEAQYQDTCSDGCGDGCGDGEADVAEGFLVLLLLSAEVFVGAGFPGSAAG